MPALTTNRKNEILAGGASRYRFGKVGAAVRIYKGAAICRNATGFLVPAAATLGLAFAGWAQETIDNTAGGAGALEVKYLTGVSVKMKNSAVSVVVQAQMGRPVYLEDDQTVRATPGAAGVLVGLAETIDADGGIWVFGDPEVSIGAVAGEDLATVSDTQTAAGVPVAYTFLIPDAATADYDRVIDQKIEVYDVVVIKDVAGAGNTVTAKSAAAVITDAIAAAVDKVVTRAGTIDRVNSTIAAGGILRLSVVRAAGSSAMKVVVLGIKRA